MAPEVNVFRLKKMQSAMEMLFLENIALKWGPMGGLAVGTSYVNSSLELPQCLLSPEDQGK